MKHKTFRLTIAALALIVSALTGLAQQSIGSPYSRFGYGLLNDNASSAQRQMGGVGYAMQSGRQINAMNPASYAAIDSLTFLFDMGFDFTSVSRREGSDKENSIGGGLDYINMQFPIARRFGMSIGLLPYSSVGYSFGSKIDNGSSAHEGTGGLNILYLGIAGRIVKGLSVGANIGYLFGTTYNDVYAHTNTSSTSLFEQIIQVRDYHLDFGIQYRLEINRRHALSAGLTYSPGKTLLGHTWVQKYDINSDAAPDTIGYASIRNRFSIPDTWGAGIAYEWNRALFVEADFTYQPWSKAKIGHQEDFTSTTFCDRYRVGLGAAYTPAQRGGYLRRITYRLGGHWARDYMEIGTNHVREYGLSCGFGFPAPGGKTVINLGFDWIHRSCTPQALVTENYFNIRLGVNFNQLWFMQSKLR